MTVSTNFRLTRLDYVEHLILSVTDFKLCAIRKHGVETDQVEESDDAVAK